MAHGLCGFPPQNTQSSSNHKGNVRQSQMRGNLQNAWLVIVKTIRGHEKQGKSEKLSQPREAEEDMMVKCDTTSWMGPWNRTRTLGFPSGSTVENLPAKQEMQEMQIWSLGREGPLEKEMSTYTGILALEIPWTGEPGGLQSMGSQSQTCWVTKHASTGKYE